jgi:hypothetical protein
MDFMFEASRREGHEDVQRIEETDSMFTVCLINVPQSTQHSLSESESKSAPFAEYFICRTRRNKLSL